MGSGISLSDEQVTQIIKRDLTQEYHTLYTNRKPCAPEWESYRNFLDEEKYKQNTKYVDMVYQMRQNKYII